MLTPEFLTIQLCAESLNPSLVFGFLIYEIEMKPSP